MKFLVCKNYEFLMFIPYCVIYDCLSLYYFIFDVFSTVCLVSYTSVENKVLSLLLEYV